MHFKRIACHTLLALLAFLAGCSDSDTAKTIGQTTDSPAASSGGRVVVYSSVDEVFAEPICRQFERDTGITVDLVPDTEETKSTGLLNRLIAEQDRPRADVFWSGDPVRAAILKSRGVSAAYDSPAIEGLPLEFSDPEHHWTCSSNGEVRRRVANGQFAIGLTDTDDVNEAIRDGKPVGFVYPDVDGIGTLVVPNAVVLIAGGPNSENAKRFIDYLLRPETEAALARSDAAQMPLRNDVELPDGFPFKPVTRLKAMAIDYNTLAGKLEELSGGFLKQWVDENQ